MADTSTTSVIVPAYHEAAGIADVVSALTNSSVLLIVVSVVIFLMGLVSEQIAALRFEGRR